MPSRDFVQCLARLAEDRGNAVALTVVSQPAGAEAREEVFGYATLWTQVRALAATLQREAVPGERALLLLDNDQHYVVGLFACFAAGIIAVPVFPPESARPQHVARLAGIAADAQARLVLTTAALAPLVTTVLPALGVARLVEVDRADPALAGQWVEYQPVLTDTAFLQYTSGSTSDPKGVMVTHACLMANEAAIRALMAITAADRFAVWSPLFHDMGLIGGLLQPFYSGIPCVLCSPDHFTASPVRWLRLISQHRVTVSGGPDFAYRLCIDRVRESQCDGLDLSCWRVAYTGAEPIRPDTMQTFVDRFGRCGFAARAVYPCYGLAEGTLMVTGVPPGHGMHTVTFSETALARGQVLPEGDGVALVACGQAAAGHAVRIVDPGTGQMAAPNRVGEIWASGPSMAAGYWQNAPATADAFVTDDDGVRWLRTGDLGFVHEGQLFVAGRLKDMIIVRGHNLYPQDIEQAIENQLDEVRKGRVAAFAVAFDGQEGVGVAAEISRSIQRRVPPDALAGQIAAVVSAQTGESPQVIALLQPGGMPKTSSGKLQRQRCRQQWQTQTLDVWALFEQGVLTQSGAVAQPAALTQPDTPMQLGAPVRPGVPMQPDTLTQPGVVVQPDTLTQPGAATDESHESQASGDHGPALQGLAAELAKDWYEALGTPRTTALTRHSHFFMLGGNSLSAVTLATRIARRYRVPFWPSHVFEHPRLDDMAACVTALGQQVQAGALPATDGPVALTPEDRALAQPLSPAQMRQWFLWQLDPAGTSYVIQGALEVSGALDAQALHRAVDQLVLRHASLRTQFLLTAGGPVRQRVLPTVPAVWLPEEQPVPLSERTARMQALAAQPFDLLAGPLARFVLLRHDAHRHTLVLLVHHIVADAASMQILLDDLGALYAVQAGLSASAPPEDAPQYIDYAVWQQAHPEQAFSAADVAWWQHELGTEHPPLTLSPGHQPADAAARPAGLVEDTVPAALFARVRERAVQLGTTPFVLLLTAWQLLLFRYSGQHCIRVGVPVANREMPAVAGMVGCFVNTLVLQLRIDGRARLGELLAHAAAHHRQAQRHARVPFDHLVEVLHPDRVPGVNPLFQVAFNYLQEDFGGFSRHTGLGVQPVLPVLREAQFELTLEVRQPDADSAGLRFIFDTRVLPAGLVARMAVHYRDLLLLLTGDTGARVGDLDFIGPHQRQQLAGWETGAQSQEDPATVVAAFAHHAAACPGATALLFGEHTLSRGELAHRARAVAQALQARGVRPEDRVGIHQERSLDLVVSMLGVLMAGAAFVPLDPELPPQRLAFMMQDSGLKVVLTHDRLLAAMPAVAGVMPLLLEHIFPPASTAQADAVPSASLAQAGAAQPASPAQAGGPLPVDAAADSGASWQAPALHGNQLAYVIYTSGSTGQPKGVGVNHRGLATCMAWMQRVYGLGDDDTVLHKAPIGFDVSCWEIFWPLSAGIRLAIAQPGDHRDPQRIFDLIERHRITTLNFVPQMLQLFLSRPDAAGTGLRHVMCGGEAISARVQSEAVQKLGAGVLQNLYGPTETTIHVTRWTCQDDGRTPVPIGRPIDATQAHVLDAALNRVPAGVAGELYIGGDLLARGYINQPALTAERFVANPFVQVGSRLYRTGDLVRWNEAGQLEYLGRIDEQIKIRGFRVELGEVEAQLLRQPGVREAVVVARETPQGTQLVGYVSGDAADAARAAGAGQGRTLDGATLRLALGAVLPDYMVPSVIVVLAALPLNANGKIDRRALPAPVFDTGDTYEAPQGELEQKLAQIWAGVLGISRPDRQKNFFELGGHSLLLATLHQRIQDELNVRVGLVDLFQFPTIQAQAAHLSALRAAPGSTGAAQASDDRGERRRQAMLRRKRV